ncbi:MAG: hypothetical protein Q8M76_08070 [Spirochaetaceae bacterium]|nr:hypothetical protein [Spirochaetaceae bacterium]
MTSGAFALLSALREDFRALVARWTEEHPYLGALQESLRRERGYDDYRIETPIVYNRALDALGPEDEVQYVLVADNPGKNEQLARNNKYLVGQSGKLAESWFGRELGADFRATVLILNKTPVHTPKTAELRRLLALSGGLRPRLEELLRESQVAMAELAIRAAAGLGATLWISGLGELRDGGLFRTYRDELSRRLAVMPLSVRNETWAFNHFSMNRFSIEVAQKSRKGEPRAAALARIGAENRVRIFGL